MDGQGQSGELNQERTKSMTDSATVDAPQTTNQAPAAPAAETKPTLLAGKYADQAALEKGIREGMSKAQFEDLPEGELIGEGKRFPSVAAAEKYYRGIDRIISAGKAAEPGVAKPTELKLGGGTEPISEDIDVPDMLDKAGISFEDAEAAFSKDGKLTDEQLKAIRKNQPWMSHKIATRLAKAELADRKLANLADQQSLADAAQVMGGMDKLDALVKAAGSFVDKKEWPEMHKALNDPKRRVTAVRLLKQMHAEHIGAGGAAPVINGTGGGAGGPSISTAKEYFDLQSRALAGEDNLWPIIQSIDVSKLKV